MEKWESWAVGLGGVTFIVLTSWFGMRGSPEDLESYRDDPYETRAPSTGDYDCSDFSDWKEAQKFFLDNSPDRDPHNLDRNGDGIACESLLN